MQPQVKLTDFAIWFKHVEDADFRMRLSTLRDDEEINLEIDGVVGRWRRMKRGSDGRPTNGLRPYGGMKAIWSEWYYQRRGDMLPLREVHLADNYFVAMNSMMPEWESPEDEEAYRDL